MEHSPQEQDSQALPEPPPLSLQTQLSRVLFALLALIVVGALLQNYRPFDPSEAIALESDIQRRREIIWSNCEPLEAVHIRNPASCVSAYEYDRLSWLRPFQDPIRGALPTFEVQGNWLSAYGLVLDYHASYPTSASVLPRIRQSIRRGATKRTLKCSLGAGMSIVWDVLFRSPPGPVWHTAVYGENSSYTNRTHENRLACPPSPFSEDELEQGYAKQSSAVLNIWINCDRDINRNFLGNPLGDEDTLIREQCQRRAWLWARDAARIDVENVEPWRDLCRVASAENDTDVECFFGMGWQMEFGWRSIDGS